MNLQTESILNFDDKVKSVITIIDEIIKSDEKIIFSYSGGKDSRLIKRFFDVMNIRFPMIHNIHPGEDINNNKEVLCTKAPKSNMNKILEFLEFDSFIDGSRKYEEKTVIFDSVEIERINMPSFYNPNGVFMKPIWMPLFYLSDEDVVSILNLSDSEFKELILND